MLTELVAAITLLANASALIIVRVIIFINRNKPADDADAHSQAPGNHALDAVPAMPGVDRNT
ncbi:hypothetical protein BH11PSE11_BH11PSE11_24100 [soil metagenome]